jgi:uncharacterized membrane protein
MENLFRTFFDKIDVLRFLTAFTVMGAFFLIVNALIYREIPEGNKEILIHVLGIVEGAVMTIVGYEFGSSKDKRKPESPDGQQ